jgi:5-methyltetrahydrofolate--homocysteine methyltransferase
MSELLSALSERVLLCDGAMGSRVQALDLDIERDYWGKENCTEVLNLSRPELVVEIHKGYYAAGSDMVETNSFGGSPITLGEFQLEDRAFEINKRAAELAREAAESFRGDGRRRFVLGAVGPGTRLPSLGHVDYDTMEPALAVQCAGLIAGGADAILIETCQDPLQIKVAVNAAKAARAEAGRDSLPILVQLLVGTDIAAAATVIKALDVPVMGVNCATGPQEMAPHVEWLAENWPGLISVQPNAGLPELVDGQTRYPLGPGELAKWLDRFLGEDGINLIGGCCGTTPEHIAALDAMLRRRAGGGGARPAPKQRTSVWVPGLASLYGQVSYRQENAYLSIGERCNANGSKAFRRLQEQGDWDGCVAMGVEQVKEGSHAIDLCTAFVGRDEISEMTEVAARMRGAVDAPLVLDSTEYPTSRTARSRRPSGSRLPASSAPRWSR